MLTTGYAWDEAERNLQRHKPEALAAFYGLRGCIGINIEPSNALVMHLASYLPRKQQLPKKDWPILAGAISAGANYLVTHDAEDFGPLYGVTVYGVEIQRPAMVLTRLQQSTKGEF